MQTFFNKATMPEIPPRGSISRVLIDEFLKNKE